MHSELCLFSACLHCQFIQERILALWNACNRVCCINWKSWGKCLLFFVICSCLVCVTWLQSSSVWCNQILSRLNVFLHYNNIYPSSDGTFIWAFYQVQYLKLGKCIPWFCCVMVIPLCFLPFNDILSSEKRKLLGAISDG